MIFSPLLRDCRSQLQAEASCVLYKCNHFLRSERSFPPNTLILVLSSQKHLYFIPIRTFLQLFRARNCYKFISLDLHDPLLSSFSSSISASKNSCPEKGTSFQVSILSYSDFTLFSHQAQYFNTFFHYPINRNRTASLEQNTFSYLTGGSFCRSLPLKTFMK